MTALRKVWRDLWIYKVRSLLVILSITFGVTALGAIISSRTQVAEQMNAALLLAHHAQIRLVVDTPLNDDAILSLRHLPEVTAVQGFARRAIHWKLAPSETEWRDATLIAVDDYKTQELDIIELLSGQWPGFDADRTVAVEAVHVDYYHIPALGGTLYFEQNGYPRAFTVSGTTRNLTENSPPFATVPTFYVSRPMLAELTDNSDFDDVRLNVTHYTPALAQATADSATARLRKLGTIVIITILDDPEHPASTTALDGLLLILGVMAVTSLALSAFLVINTITALVAQQVPQIGIMKTIGGLSSQIAGLYLSGVAIYGVLSLALAAPLGALGGFAVSRFLLTVFNIAPPSLSLVASAFFVQIAVSLLVPILAALWPITRGVTISVREALAAYGVGAGRYGGGLLDRLFGSIRGLPRMAALALRNTFRRAGRVALTQLTLITAGAVFIMVQSTQTSFEYSIGRAVNNWGYDVVLIFEQPQRFSEIQPQAAAYPGVETVELWIWDSALLHSPGETKASASHQVQLRGIPADTHLYAPDLTAGRGFLPGDRYTLLLNQKIAADMGVGVGDKVVLDLGTQGESTWTVVGLIFDISYNQQTVYLDRDTLATEMRQTGRTSVVELRVREKTATAQTAVETGLRARFEAQGIRVVDSLSVLKFREIATAQFMVIGVLLVGMTLMIGAVGGFGLSSTLAINVLERRREIGVMRAVGASSGDIALMFMGEGLLLGFLSWLTAAPLGLISARYFVEALYAAINFPASTYIAQDAVWIWLAVVLTLAALASVLPARQATQVSVREALAYE